MEAKHPKTAKSSRPAPFKLLGTREPLVANTLHYWAITWPFLSDIGPRIFEHPQPSADVLKAGVHFTEEAVFDRPITAGDKLQFECTVYSVSQKKRGSVIGLRFDFTDASASVPRGNVRNPALEATCGPHVLTQWASVFFVGLKLQMVDTCLDHLRPPAVLHVSRAESQHARQRGSSCNSRG